MAAVEVRRAATGCQARSTPPRSRSPRRRRAAPCAGPAGPPGTRRRRRPPPSPGGRRPGAAAPGRRRRAAVAQRAHERREALPGRVQVEVGDVRVAPVPEAVHDERRHASERPRRHHHALALGSQPDGQLALEHVEEVGVAAVDVQVRALAAGAEPRPRRVQRVVVGEDLDPPVRRVADDLAAAAAAITGVALRSRNPLLPLTAPSVVAAGPADADVAAGPADQAVVAVASAQLVVALVAGEAVAAASPTGGVVAGAAGGAVGRAGELERLAGVAAVEVVARRRRPGWSPTRRAQTIALPPASA